MRLNGVSIFGNIYRNCICYVRSTLGQFDCKCNGASFFQLILVNALSLNIC